MKTQPTKQNRSGASPRRKLARVGSTDGLALTVDEYVILIGIIEDAVKNCTRPWCDVCEQHKGIGNKLMPGYFLMRGDKANAELCHGVAERKQ